MAPHNGLVHLKEYDIKDSNVELIGSDLDHKVKHASAETEPAWNDGHVGISPGLFVWRIENFTVVPVPKATYGHFYDGDSYIILHSQQVKTKEGEEEATKDKLTHAIHFYLGSHTTADEAGTAAYKTVELDSFLHGTATQYREIRTSTQPTTPSPPKLTPSPTESNPSTPFLTLFPRLTILTGGHPSGFRHVPQTPTTAAANEPPTLLRVFRPPTTTSGNTVIIHQVPAHWQSLDSGDVFIVEHPPTGKIWVWQGAGCSPMEKARAAAVVHERRMVAEGGGRWEEVEVVAQGEGRARVVVRMLGGGGGGGGEDGEGEGMGGGVVLKAGRPVVGLGERGGRGKRLFRLSDESGELRFGLVRDGGVSRADLDGNDVFVLDDGGRAVWVWEGQGASRAEKAMWLRVAQAYVRKLQSEDEDGDAYLTPIAKVREGCESPAFLRAIAAA
jgi:gelsolin